MASDLSLRRSRFAISPLQGAAQPFERFGGVRDYKRVKRRISLFWILGDISGDYASALFRFERNRSSIGEMPAARDDAKQDRGNCLVSIRSLNV
jgi:hypothetical protein